MASKTLVIVESPAKAKKIAGYLGAGYTVMASVGHIRDLPVRASEVPAEFKGLPWSRLGVNTDSEFEPIYVVDADKKSRIAEIKKRAEESDAEAQEVAYSQRPVIEMPICLGEEERTIEVNLTDRSTFSYPLLIGASAMRDLGAAVNPAERYTRDRPQC